jgi:amidohydrolase
MKKYYEMVEKFKDEILSAERYIWKNPEPGYKEFKTNTFMLEKFKALGYDVVEADNITGFYATLDTGKEGPTVLVLAELDSLINFSHPECDKETGAVHSCGHNTQCAAILGLASALKEDGALEGLCGKIKLCLVPAEEGIELGYRKRLVADGKIKFTSGKPEFISRRYFDDVDIAFMIHVFMAEEENVKFYIRSIAEKARHTNSHAIVLSAVYKLPVELEKYVTVLNIPLPDRGDRRGRRGGGSSRLPGYPVYL